MIIQPPTALFEGLAGSGADIDVVRSASFQTNDAQAWSDL